MQQPELRPRDVGGIRYWTDPALSSSGLLVAFTERVGGTSAGAYSTLNLAGHVGDEPERVDENRARALGALGIGSLRDRVVTAEQVHGDAVHVAGQSDAGAGAYVSASRTPAVRGTDALLTRERDLPLMLFFADCVPIVLVEPSLPAVGVVHAGWRGALAGLPGTAVRTMAERWSVSPGSVRAYVGPHICAHCYRVGADVLSQFVHTFVTVAPGEGGELDLASAVTESLQGAGVHPTQICSLDACTAETTDRFYSYRAAEGLTGRHAAVTCILGQVR